VPHRAGTQVSGTGVLPPFPVDRAFDRLSGHPQLRSLFKADLLVMVILDSRRQGLVPSRRVYTSLAESISTVLDCFSRQVPFGDVHELESPDPAWSVAMALRARVQGQHRLARAHLLAALRTLLSRTPEVHT
jgi:hypothetical protein